MTTMRLHKFIKISNYSDEYFVNTMPDTSMNNRDSEFDFDDTKNLMRHMENKRQNKI